MSDRCLTHRNGCFSGANDPGAWCVSLGGGCDGVASVFQCDGAMNHKWCKIVQVRKKEGAISEEKHLKTLAKVFLMTSNHA